MKMHADKEHVQYSVRGIPREVDRVLRARAAKRHISLNQAVVDELVRATIGRSQRADFSDLVGKWQADPQFDAILKDQRRIDRKEWS